MTRRHTQRYSVGATGNDRLFWFATGAVVALGLWYALRRPLDERG